MKIAAEDRRILGALLAEIHNPNTTPERREECRDEHSAIVRGRRLAVGRVERPMPSWIGNRMVEDVCNPVKQ